MQLTTFLMTLLVVTMLMLFSAPASEATSSSSFERIVCMLRSPQCPSVTNATTA